jgi:S-adenosylmethionine hydrolase
MIRPIITLTTDFGADSPYVAEMKAAIYAVNRRVEIVDLTHSIPPQKVRQGAMVLARSTPYFPPKTIHVCVVDPGVGGDRAILYAAVGEQRYVLPDNGLLSGLAVRSAPSTMVAVENSRYWRADVSATFHGRDIMAPVAAWLSLGLNPLALGPVRREFIQIAWPEAHVLAAKITGEIVTIDSFGNLVTNITTEMLARIPDPQQATIRCDEHETIGIWRTYADQPAMTLMALVGSSGQLELAIVEDSAKLMLGVREGEQVTVSW